jgi:hypothetical protein
MTNQTNATETLIRCSNCGMQFPAHVYSYVDAVQEPRAKALLLSGQLNSVPCPSCGNLNTMMTPLLYHDPTKELLIALVPMELNLNKDEQERTIGQMMNRLPKENFKGYMFNPRRSISMQGLVEQILEADGVTKEMIEEQKARVQLAQKFVEADSEETLLTLIKDNDEKIDERLITTLTALAQRVLESGQQELAQHIMNVQQVIVGNSKLGAQLAERQQQQQAVVQEVTAQLEQLGAGADRGQFLELALTYAEKDLHLQALVTLVRPAFDYTFFELMTEKIDNASPEEKPVFEKVRDNILKVTTAIDQQQQMVIQQAAGFLQAVINENDPRQALLANAHLVDDVFMQVLEMNIQQAEQQANIQLLTRLKQVQQIAYEALQSQMAPELRFINDLLEVEEPVAQQMIVEKIGDFGAEILEVMQAISTLLQQQGNQELLARLQSLYAFAENQLNG